jgi:hypothetical protein
MYRQKFVERVLKRVTPKEQAELPADVQEWIQDKKTSKGVYHYSGLEHDYLLISIGFRPNPGYRVEIAKVAKEEESDEEVTVYIKEWLPEPKKMYPQVIVYPYILAEIKGKEKIQVQLLTSDGEPTPF